MYDPGRKSTAFPGNHLCVHYECSLAEPSHTHEREARGSGVMLDYDLYIPGYSKKRPCGHWPYGLLAFGLRAESYRNRRPK